MYKIGFCPQCDTQIMVQDTNGRWNSYKQNFRQADITFESGTRVRTIICDKCLDNPDFGKLISAITHCNTEACTHDVSERIKSKGLPIKIELAAKAKQGIRIGV